MKRIRTVVADDNDGFRSSLLALLSTMPFLIVVGEATDGFEAIKCVDELHPDLLLLDLHMPNLSGWQVLSEIQQRPVRPHVIILSGYTNAIFADVVQEHGVYAYLSKDHPRVLAETLTALAKEMDAAGSSESPQGDPRV